MDGHALAHLSITFLKKQAISLATDDDCGKLMLRDGDALAHFYTDFLQNRQTALLHCVLMIIVGN